MHPISSWMSAIDLGDDLTLRALEPGEASRWRVAWADDAPRPSPIDWPIEKDLAVRAHRALEARCGRTLPVEGLILKRTPVGGGLGGGSADAGAALSGLNELFSLGLRTADLRGVAETLGSDVAFFVDDHTPARPAIVGGFGERIERVGAVAADVLLLLPAFGTPTGPVYRAYDASPRALRDAEVRRLAADGAATGRIDPGRLFNDLAEPACRVEPRLGALMERVRALGPAVHVSGSGSTLMVVDPAPGAEGRVRGAIPDVAVVRTRLVG
jgi:4-diphosphocytidyl-2-C-methyl-D-erythritol kinase